MRTVVSVAMLGAALTCPCLPCFDGTDTVAAASRVDERFERTSFYQVPLICPAARGLGCGSAAKPVLLDLERTSVIDEAWLDQAGQTLAVVWARDTGAPDRKATLRAVAEARELDVEELTGERLASASTGFQFGKGWHRGADVDRLSEQEAHVIADRLLARLVTKAPSAAPKTAALRPALTKTIEGLLVGSCPSLAECRDKIVAMARQHLTPAELTALTEAMEMGYRPVGNER